MSFRLVAVDTTSEFGSIALLEDGVLLEEVPLHSPDGFGHVLFQQLEQVLQRHGWRYTSVSAFAAASGPGSFTGVRVGLTAVKGLAEAAGVVAAGVPLLQAVAYHGEGPLRAPLMDARRGEVYGGLYDAAGVALAEDTVSPIGSWLNGLPVEARIVTPEPERFIHALAGRAVDRSPRALAGAIGRLAPRHLQDPALIDANYVRRSDAEMAWKES